MKPGSRPYRCSLGACLAMLTSIASAAGSADARPHTLEEPQVTIRSADAQRAGRLRDHVRALAGEIGERNVLRPQALRAAASYVRAQWQADGFEVVSHPYRVAGMLCENLEVTIAGGAKATEILVIGAHYDTVPGTPGANDNASGVAALIELARELRGSAPERTVRFVAFVNEEPPFFPGDTMGSAVYARAARERGDDIRLMVSLEMLGFYSDRPGSQTYPPLLGLLYPDRANFIGFVSNLRSRAELAALARAFRRHSDFPAESLAAFEWIPGLGWSDHASFWRYGYPAVMVTDTAFHRYVHYHAPTDTPDKLVYDAMARVVDGLRMAFVELAR
jgi:Zn-dependent M28 family amino/carboxypeptidase